MVALGYGYRGIPGTHWPANRAKSMSSGFSKRQRGIEENTWLPGPLMHLHKHEHMYFIPTKDNMDCGSLNVSHGLWYLNIWSPIGGAGEI